MRWSELAAKECVDLVLGEKLGSLSKADLSFNPRTGQVESIFVPVGSSWFGRNTKVVKINWCMIRKVGPEMVIIESNLNAK